MFACTGAPVYAKDAKIVIKKLRRAANGARIVIPLNQASWSGSVRAKIYGRKKMVTVNISSGKDGGHC